MPVTLRSTASAPISPLTHALLSLHRGFSDYDNMFPALFPVIKVVNNQGNPIRNYKSIPPKTLKEAVAQYGPTAPYTISLIQNLTISALPPTDWGHLSKACLSGGEYLLWRANYEDGAYEQTERNRQQQIPITLNMLPGRGQYEPLAAQATLPTEAFAQINTLATRAWQLTEEAKQALQLLKAVSMEAASLVAEQGTPRSPSVMFVAMMAILSCQVPVGQSASQVLWAYVPDPPVLRPVTWNNP
ncbi:Gag polyprotein [Plecturocebus cupreus]